MLRFSSTLLLAATCLLVGTGAEKATVCGNHVQRLSCETGVIRVDQSLYGRADSEICSGGKPFEEVANTGCSLQGADDIIKARCTGKKVCEITPAIFSTDPCPETFKYVQTNYTCVPANHLIICEHSLMHLECDEGKVLFVYHADFGRRDADICSFRRDRLKLQNLRCSNPTGKVGDRCNGRKDCTMRAASSVFGDSCPDTYKYLEVTYTCLSS